MYNRYIPKDDGSYTRNRVQESVRTPPPAPKEEPVDQHQWQEKEPVSRKEQSPVSFLKQLLPKGFDTGDLFIVLLLLLMAGDCEEDRNNALLTLALYFLM